MRKSRPEFAGWRRGLALLGLILPLLWLGGCATAPPEAGAGAAEAKKKSALPPEAQAAYERARWSVQAGRDQEAMDLFRQMTQKWPDLEIGHVNLGLLLLRAGKTDEALAALERAVQLRPDDAVAWNHLGIALRHKGQFHKALDAYRQALKIRPDYANAYRNLGILYDIYLQELPQALDAYKRYQQLTGGDDETVKKWIVDLERRVAAAQKGKTG